MKSYTLTMPLVGGSELVLGSVRVYEQEKRMELDLKVKFSTRVCEWVLKNEDN